MANSSLSLISDLTIGKDDSKITVRISRLWNHIPAGSKEAITLNMILLDENGSKIHASILKKELILRHKGTLIEGNCCTIQRFNVDENKGDYKTTNDPHRIFFHYGTQVKRSDAILPYYSFNFVPFNDILSETNENSKLIDVIGAITEWGEPQDYQYGGYAGKKITFQLEDERKLPLSCTIFGEEAVCIANCLREGPNTVIAILQLARMKTHQNVMTLTNSWNATKALLNLNVPEANNFKHRPTLKFISEEVSHSQLTYMTSDSLLSPFSDSSLRRSIGQLKQASEPGKFAVIATIQKINMNENWFYQSCNMCRKKLETINEAFWCHKCNKQPAVVIPRYMTHLTVVDDTGIANFVLFDREGFQLFKKTAHDLRKEISKSEDVYAFPELFNSILKRKFVFIVEVSYQFNIMKKSSTFTIVKLTENEDIVNEFIESSIESQINQHLDQFLDESLNTNSKESAIESQNEIVSQTAENDEDCMTPYSVNNNKRVLESVELLQSSPTISDVEVGQTSTSKAPLKKPKI